MKDRDTFSKSDPICVLFTKELGKDRWYEVCTTAAVPWTTSMWKHAGKNSNKCYLCLNLYLLYYQKMIDFINNVIHKAMDLPYIINSSFSVWQNRNDQGLPQSRICQKVYDAVLLWAVTEVKIWIVSMMLISLSLRLKIWCICIDTCDVCSSNTNNRSTNVLLSSSP